MKDSVNSVVLAIDPGFGRMGVAVLAKENGKEELLHSDCVETPKTMPIEERLSAMKQAIVELNDKWQPGELAVEKLFFAKNQKTAMQVAEARGVVLSVGQELGLDISEYAPVEIKVSVTGNGAASKAQVADMVKRLVQIDKIPKHDDEYDAIAVGLCHLASMKYPQ